MTYIIATITDDSVLLTADSKVLNMKDEVISLNTRKLFHVKNGVFWGAAASGINEGELDQVNSWLQLYLPLIPPYDITLIGQMYAMAVKKAFETKPDSFWFDFVIAGFSRNEDGNPLNPKIIYGTSKDGYQCRFSDRIAVGQVTDADHKKLKNISKTTSQAVTESREIITGVQEREITVGGEIRTVIIKDMGKKKFKELIKKASQPVPKEQDK